MNIDWRSREYEPFENFGVGSMPLDEEGGIAHLASGPNCRKGSTAKNDGARKGRLRCPRPFYIC